MFCVCGKLWCVLLPLYTPYIYMYLLGYVRAHFLQETCILQCISQITSLQLIVLPRCQITRSQPRDL